MVSVRIRRRLVSCGGGGGDGHARGASTSAPITWSVCAECKQREPLLGAGSRGEGAAACCAVEDVVAVCDKKDKLASEVIEKVGY
jgi:hypothetical protein